jgi:hypothetical protein
VKERAMRILERLVDLPRDLLPFVLLLGVAAIVAWLILDARKQDMMAQRPVRLEDRSTWRRQPQVDNASFWAFGVAIIFACFMLGRLVAEN